MNDATENKMAKDEEQICKIVELAQEACFCYDADTSSPFAAGAMEALHRAVKEFRNFHKEGKTYIPILKEKKCWPCMWQNEHPEKEGGGNHA